MSKVYYHKTRDDDAARAMVLELYLEQCVRLASEPYTRDGDDAVGQAWGGLGPKRVQALRPNPPTGKAPTVDRLHTICSYMGYTLVCHPDGTFSRYKVSR